MAFVIFPSTGLRLGPARRPRFGTSMCSRTWYPKTIEDIPKPVRIALTREPNKNVPLRTAVRETFPYAEVLELPCIESIPGADRDKLVSHLAEGTVAEGWVVITSPEAANVFISAWRKADYPRIGRIAALGKATGDSLRAVGLEVAFQPTKATGKTLVKELPSPITEGEVVLYPASAIASSVVPDGLGQRGYSVIRLDTYSTVSSEFSPSYREMAEGVDIVTFASPSAIKGWVANVGINDGIAVACIGETSAKAAKSIGFKHVHYPSQPGIEGWISAICEAYKVYEAKSVMSS